MKKNTTVLNLIIATIAIIVFIAVAITIGIKIYEGEPVFKNNVTMPEVATKEQIEKDENEQEKLHDYLLDNGMPKPFVIDQKGNNEVYSYEAFITNEKKLKESGKEYKYEILEDGIKSKDSNYVISKENVVKILNFKGYTSLNDKDKLVLGVVADSKQNLFNLNLGMSYVNDKLVISNDIIVDWGDGTIEKYQNKRPFHKYKLKYNEDGTIRPTEYIIKAYGKANGRINFEEEYMLRKVHNFGNFVFGNGAFANHKNLESVSGEIKLEEHTKSLFENDSKLIYVAEGIFDKADKTINLIQAFKSTGLTYVNKDMFKNMKELKEIYGIFNNTMIEYIPNNLFINNKKIEQIGELSNDNLALKEALSPKELGVNVKEEYKEKNELKEKYLMYKGSKNISNYSELFKGSFEKK